MQYPQILALDVTGQPHSWMHWQDAVTLKVKGAIAWEFGKSDFLVRGGVNRLSGTQSTIDISSIIALKGRFKSRTTVSLTNPNLFQRDLHVCGYCGKPYRDSQLTRDHIKPRSRGGKDVWTNVITACKSCNNVKDDMTPDEADMPLLYVPYAPSPIEGLILRGRNILSDQMDFLKSMLPEHSRLLKDFN